MVITLFRTVTEGKNFKSSGSFEISCIRLHKRFKKILSQVFKKWKGKVQKIISKTNKFMRQTEGTQPKRAQKKLYYFRQSNTRRKMQLNQN